MEIHLKNRFVEYKFSIKDKYTIVRGDSASGKTTLVDLFAAYERDPSSIQCSGYNKLRVLPFFQTLKEAHNFLSSISNNVFIVDEAHNLFSLAGYEKVLHNSKNYFIIIDRDKSFRNLPIHLRSITVIKSSGKFHTLVQQDSEYLEDEYGENFEIKIGGTAVKHATGF